MRLAVLAALLTACGGGAINAGDDQPAIDAQIVDATPPTPAGCITDVSTGDHVYTCGGLRVDARIPAKCQAPGCGLILELHGDTGTGLLMDGHTKLRELGDQNGYIVIAPSGPPWPGSEGGSTWNSTNDATLVDMTMQFRDVFRVSPQKIHVTGFSRGAFVTWRLLCDYPGLFASAAPAGAGFGKADFGENTCFHDGRFPTRTVPFILLMGRTDVAVGYQNMVAIRDAAIARYGVTSAQVLASDANYTHTRWSIPLSAQPHDLIETFDHTYETVSPGPFASAKGHCIPGSTSDPQAPQYAIPCKLPNAFVWGEEVMRFFIAHPF